MFDNMCFLFEGYRHIRLLDGHNDPTTATLDFDLSETMRAAKRD